MAETTPSFGLPLLPTLVARQFRIQTKRSAIGLVWPAIAPIFLFGLYEFVFHTVFSVPVRHYGEFLFAGLLPWTFLAQALGQTVTSLSADGDLIRRVRFPYEFLPIASAAVVGLYFLVDLAGFMVYLAVEGRLPSAPLLLLPVCVGALFLLVSSLSLALALIDVYNRDLRRLLSNLLTVWFFLLPVVYRQSMVPARLRFLRSVDPMNLIIGQFRSALYRGASSAPGHTALMLMFSTMLFAIVLTMFRRLSVDLPKDV